MKPEWSWSWSSFRFTTTRQSFCYLLLSSCRSWTVFVLGLFGTNFNLIIKHTWTEVSAATLNRFIITETAAWITPKWDFFFSKSQQKQHLWQCDFKHLPAVLILRVPANWTEAVLQLLLNFQWQCSVPSLRKPQWLTLMFNSYSKKTKQLTGAIGRLKRKKKSDWYSEPVHLFCINQTNPNLNRACTDDICSLSTVVQPRLHEVEHLRVRFYFSLHTPTLSPEPLAAIFLFIINNWKFLIA